jgi:prenyltransferase beta subunit
VNSNHYTPFYVQMIALLENALALLDEQGREEVVQFIVNSQNEDGGFRDRGGNSDLYYSLFGLLILSALARENKEQQETQSSPVTDSLLKLKQFTQNQSSIKVQGFIEKCCLVLLQSELKSKRYYRFISMVSLGRSFWKERTSINLSYRSFVLFLTLDAVLPVSSFMKGPAKKMMERTVINEHSPCSEVAAKVFLNKMMKKENSMELELLQSFVAPAGGFKAFNHLDQADMLSTAVALFALKYADADLRLIKPSTLDFIQSNYSLGAFLSGDDDQTEDVEYTFYGLLALGVLVN